MKTITAIVGAAGSGKTRFLEKFIGRAVCWDECTIEELENCIDFSVQEHFILAMQNDITAVELLKYDIKIIQL